MLKEKYEKIQISMNKIPKDFDKLFQTTPTTVKDEEILKLKTKISSMDQITLNNEEAMREDQRKKIEEISELKEEIALLKIKLNKKPIMIHPDIVINEVRKEENLKNCAILENKEKIIKNIVKTLEESNENKKKLKSELDLLRHKLYKKTSRDLDIEIRRTYNVIEEDDFDRLYKTYYE